MKITTDPNLWAICGLVFLLGLLVGVFLTAGGRRKWKTRYKSEGDRREALGGQGGGRGDGEGTRREALERQDAELEKESRERDSLRAAAIKDPALPGDGEIRSM